ncbi:UDP-glycosyltransferase 73B5 [Panicum miliaceum]|uniref:UDP-glycosyltransferase 73B5 n=1 Tax=Panicum miliaceum TaxID=4540 RepID=A0A3L6S5E5_PANMI|nr:UDP-glycosyltransferase 73B5 [Panicum miliaceum]
MEHGGAADAARRRVAELSAKARAAMAEGGTSHRDLHQLLDDIMAARRLVVGLRRHEKDCGVTGLGDPGHLVSGSALVPCTA